MPGSNVTAFSQSRERRPSNVPRSSQVGDSHWSGLGLDLVSTPLSLGFDTSGFCLGGLGRCSLQQAKSSYIFLHNWSFFLRTHSVSPSSYSSTFHWDEPKFPLLILFKLTWIISLYRFGTVHRQTCSSVTGDCIVIGYERGILERLSRAQASTTITNM